MTLDATLRPTADRLIGKLGKSATLTRESQGTFDPGSGTYTGGGTTDYSVTVTPPRRFRQDQIDGQLVQQNDFEVSVAALNLSIAPTQGDDATSDTLTMDGTVYQIIRVQPVYSGQLVAYYRLQCRV